MMLQNSIHFFQNEYIEFQKINSKGTLGTLKDHNPTHKYQ